MFDCHAYVDIFMSAGQNSIIDVAYDYGSTERTKRNETGQDNSEFFGHGGYSIPQTFIQILLRLSRRLLSGFETES